VNMWRASAYYLTDMAVIAALGIVAWRLIGSQYAYGFCSGLLFAGGYYVRFGGTRYMRWARQKRQGDASK